MPTYKEHDVLTGETTTHSTDENICHNCGSTTERSPQSVESEVTPGICLCADCNQRYAPAKRRGNVDIEYSDGVVVNVNIGGSIRDDAQEVKYKQKQCAVCEDSAAGDCQILGKIVCQSCFSRARNGDIREVRQTLEKKYNNEDLRDYEDESSDDRPEFTGNHVHNAGGEGITTDEQESDERPDDYDEWTVEQWQNAYVEDEINLIALEIGVAHALEDNMDFSGPGSEKFERSVEIATELSDSPVKEAV